VVCLFLLHRPGSLEHLPAAAALAIIEAVSVPALTPLAAALLHVPVPERALVIGCGEGEPVLLLAREFPAARVRGLDPSPASIRAASDRVGLDPEGRVAFKAGRGSRLPYPDDFFDLVAQFDGLPPAAEVARVLRPGGHLILAHSGPLGFVAGAKEKLLQRRLVRRGIATTQVAQAGNGNFFVGRLSDRPRGGTRI
jgi:SAM-dependent methyltransferase